MPEEMTYSKAGVNIEREELAIKGIIGVLQKSFKFREGRVGAVLEDIGTFANVVDLGDYALGICTDGVGSKVLVAQELEKYDTIGIDVVAMNVNDLVCIGAEPIALVDYFAVKRIDSEMAREIAIGILEGARQANVAVVGGETATLPEVICGVGERGFDLAATAVGIAKKDKIVTGRKIAPGDAVLGFKSSGVHSNGLTLARKLLPRNMWLDLLTPTRIYVKEAMTLINDFDVHGFSHMTGSGLRNLLRITKHGFVLDSMPKPQMVFRKIQEGGNISDKEMYKTFNMGVGFCAIMDESEADEVVNKYGGHWKVARIGSVVDEPGVRLVRDGEETLFT